MGACGSLLPVNSITVAKPLKVGMAELVWLEVGDFHDLSWLFGTQLIKYEGDPKKPGATRTFSSGGVETLLSFDEETRCITWSLNRFHEYEGGIRVNEDKLTFWISAKCPNFILEIAERTAGAQLDAVCMAAERRLKLSKALHMVTQFPMKDCDAYEKVVQEKEIPALKKLMAAGDVLQLRLDLNKEEKMVRAYEVWKDAESHSMHMTESFFKDIMAQLAPTVDMSRLTGKEINTWGNPDPKFSDPKFLERGTTVPRILHPTEESAVFHFRNTMDVGRDNVVLHSEMAVKSDSVKECERLLSEMNILARPFVKKECLQELRFHLDKASGKLYSLQVFDSSRDFASLLADAQAPYRVKIDSIAALGDGLPTGFLWGPSYADTPDDSIKAYCRDRGIRICTANTVNLLSRKPYLMPVPAQVQQFPSEAKEKVHALLDQLDRYTSLMLDLLPRRILGSIRDLDSEPYSVLEPRIMSSGMDRIMMGDMSFKVGKEDDYFGSQTFMDGLLFNVMSNGTLFPIDDKFIDVPDELVECMKDELLFSRIIPPANHFFPEISSDGSLQRAIMSGVFSLWLKDDPEGDFMVDYSWLTDFAPREGFRRLGATAYLDSKGNLTRIYVCDKRSVFKPGEEGWDDAKMVFKISGALCNTTVDHLVGVHMVATNPVINAAINNLPCAHTIRRCLQPFSFRSVYVNQRALKSLLDPHSIVLHACGMTSSTFNELLATGAKKSELWLTPPERIAHAGKKVQAATALEQFPYGEDSIRLYEALHLFAKEWIDGEYADDGAVAADAALQAFAKDLHEQTRAFAFGTPEKFATREELSKVVATFIFNASGQHEYAGTVQEYICHPSFMGFRLRNGSSRVDMQSWLLGLLLFSVTSLPMPMLMDDFDECFTVDAERQRWRSCQQRLKEVCSKVDTANNTKRAYPFKSFLPSLLECSVNV